MNRGTAQMVEPQPKGTTRDERPEGIGALHAVLSGRPIGEFLSGRDNNLNLLRLLAALAVLVSHSHVIATGDPATEPLRQMTGAPLGSYAIALFFGISGLLITRSFERRSSIWHFAASRVLRLWPGLLVALALTCFVLGPLISELGWKGYLSNRATWTYVPANLSLAFRADALPGVFADNPVPSSINGSLWSLFFEVLCYGGVVALGLIGALRTRTRFATCFALILAAYGVSLFVQPQGVVAYYLHTLITVAMPFSVGMACYIWRDQIRLGLAGLIVCWIGCLLFLGTPLMPSAVTILVIYSALWLAYVPKGFVLRYNRIGDFSYGTYIFAYPVQQTLMHFDPGMGIATNIALAVPVTLALAAGSWFLIEKPSLARAKQVGDLFSQLATRLGAGGKALR